MKTKLTLLLTLMLLTATTALAQKQLYIPYEWKNPWPADSLLYAESDPNNQYTWSKSRSRESDNVIVYWDKGYGSKAPDELAKSDYYYVDIDFLLQSCEQFFTMNTTTLGFCDLSKTNLNKYKVMVLMNHTQTWTCYGGGYDNIIAALWLNPATCKPIGHSVAHEVGHSFQYMCYADLADPTKLNDQTELNTAPGFRGSIGAGAAFWEQTAQWQANQSFPDLKWDQSWGIFHNTANYAMTHEWMRYQSYWWHYYLAERYGIDIIGRLWRHPTGKALQDPNQTLMSLLDIDVNELYRHYFDYAMKMATFDLDIANIRTEGTSRIGSYTYNAVPLGNAKYQVAYSSCPQSTGFNVIPLNVPEAGTVVSTDFTSLMSPTQLAEGDPKEYFNGESRYVTIARTSYNTNSNYYKHRGFRLGYVALLEDGTRQYLYEDSLYFGDANTRGNLTVTVSATVPEKTQKLFLVVVPAPREYYQHQWDNASTMDDLNIMSNDDQWPYTVEFHNTNLLGAITKLDDFGISDCTITYDVELPRDVSNYSFTEVFLNDPEVKSVLGTAFQMPVSDISKSLVNWSSAAPAEGQIKFYALGTDRNYVNAGPSANEPGHWFSVTGSRTTWENGCYLYSELNTSTMSFRVGQFPGRLTVGNTYTIGQCFRYKKDNKIATGKIIFNVKCVAATAAKTYTLKSVQQDPALTEYLTPVQGIISPAAGSVDYYAPNGMPIATPQRGINILRQPDGSTKKVLLK